MKKIYASVMTLLIVLGFSLSADAQCSSLTAVNGIYPAAAQTLPTTCLKVQVTTAAYASEFTCFQSAVVGTTYQFSSSVATDYLTVMDSSTHTVLVSGVTPVSWTATTTNKLNVIRSKDVSCAGDGSTSRTFYVQNMTITTPTIATTQTTTTTIAAGSSNVQHLRLDITPCASDNMTSMTFSTNGSTNAATDILAAKVYYTTSTTFSTTNLFGSFTSPNGSFTITGSQALTGGTIGYFWLVYDLSCIATVADVADMEVNSFTYGSTVYIPATQTTAGSRAITALYAPTRTDGNSTTAITGGAINNTMVYANISGVSSCLGSVTTVSGAASGTFATGEVLAARCYYTTSSTFAIGTAVQFGSTISSPANTDALIFTGSQALSSGTGNYFWILYDISCTAVAANTVNATINSITVGSTAYPISTGTINANVINALYAPTRTDGNSTTAITGGAINNTMVYANINGSSSCPANVTTVTGTASGTFATGEVVAAKCYYTTSSTFTLASATQFGSTISSPANTDALIFTGSQALSSGTGNYFWILYDISCTAVAANTVNATINSITVGSTAYPISTGTINANAINALYAPTRTDGNSTTAITGGAINNTMVYANINGSSSCPANVTTVTGTASGTFATGEVVAAKCYYTTSSTFTLASATQFGSTISSPANTDALIFTGSQALSSGTGNYFWILYDISCTAVAANTVNATINSITVGSTAYPISTGTINANAINALYAPTRTDGNSTTAITGGAINNTMVYANISGSSSCPANVTTVTGTASGTFATGEVVAARCYYTTSSTFAIGTAVQFGSTISSPANTDALIFTGSQALSSGTGNYFWILYDISCTAVAANTVNATINSITVGSTAYPISTGTINANAINALYAPTRTDGNSTTAITGGAINNTMVYANITGSASCPANITNVTGAASGTFIAGDVVSAKCYYTTSSAFAIGTAVQFGSTIATPASGASLVFTGSQALASGSGNYFWIVYDISCTAVAANTVNATVTSLTVGATSYAISTGTISANAITALYAPSRTDGNGTTAVTPGSVNNRMVYANISGSASCPANVTAVSYTVAGTVPATDIASARCYYTTSTTFSTVTPFGTAIANPAAGTITFTGAQALAAGTGNYFWLVYDIACGATVTNTVNGTAASVTVGATPYAISTGTISANAIAAATSYTTIADGEWNNSATWACGAIPPAAATAVTIATNVTVSNTGNIGGSVTINSGASLTVNAGGVLTLGAVGGGNRTLTANGTLTVGGGILNVNGNVIIASGSTFNQTAGDINIDGNDGTAVGSVAITTDMLGIGTSGTNYAAGTLNLTGGTITIVDPHFAGTATSTGGAALAFRAASSTGRVLGTGHTIVFGGTSGTNASTATYGFYVDTYVNSSILQLGNVTVNGGTGNRTVNVNVISGAGAINIGGDLTINTGCIMSDGVSGTTLAKTYAGNIINNGTFINGQAVILSAILASSTTAVASTVPQSIGGTGSYQNLAASPTASFGLLNIFNSSSAGVTLNVPISVSGTLTLTAGKVNTSAVNLLTVGYNAANIGTISYTAGMINGPIKKWFATATGSSLLPVGDGTNYKPATINFTTAPTTAGTLTARWSAAPSSFPNASPLTEGAIVINKVSQKGSWFVDAADGLAGGTYTATFTSNGVTDVIDRTKLVLVKRPSTGGDWTLEGTHVTTTGSNTAPVLSRTGLTAFSEFAIGGENNVALPISLEYFTGRKQAAVNVLDWKVNSSSASVLTLERSTDRVNYKTINVQTASIDRMLNPFTYTDAAPAAGVNYYRLKITNADGESKYSNVVALINKDKGFELISMAPNPVQHSTVLSLSSVKAGKIELSVSDVTGKVVIKQSVSVIAGNNPITLNFANLAAGTYQITAINADGDSKSTRFVKF